MITRIGIYSSKIAINTKKQQKRDFSSTMPLSSKDADVFISSNRAKKDKEIQFKALYNEGVKFTNKSGGLYPELIKCIEETVKQKEEGKVSSILYSVLGKIPELKVKVNHNGDIKEILLFKETKIDDFYRTEFIDGLLLLDDKEKKPVLNELIDNALECISDRDKKFKNAVLCHIAAFYRMDVEELEKRTSLMEVIGDNESYKSILKPLEYIEKEGIPALLKLHQNSPNQDLLKDIADLSDKTQKALFGSECVEGFIKRGEEGDIILNEMLKTMEKTPSNDISNFMYHNSYILLGYGKIDFLGSLFDVLKRRKKEFDISASFSTLLGFGKNKGQCEQLLKMLNEKEAYDSINTIIKGLGVESSQKFFDPENSLFSEIIENLITKRKSDGLLYLLKDKSIGGDETLKGKTIKGKSISDLLLEEADNIEKSLPRVTSKTKNALWAIQKTADTVIGDIKNEARETPELASVLNKAEEIKKQLENMLKDVDNIGQKVELKKIEENKQKAEKIRYIVKRMDEILNRVDTKSNKK